MNGKYVVLEGLDFAGKSVLAKQLSEALGWKTVNEPYTGNEHAAEVKRMNNANYLPKHYEMMMIIAGRIDCFNEVINKHRKTGLISDRNVVSSMVYQSTEQFIPSMVLELNRTAVQMAGHDIFPDQIFFLDISHATFLERLNNCNRAVDEKDLWLKDEQNWNQLREKYLHALNVMESCGVEIHIIDQNNTIDDLTSRIMEFGQSAY